MAIKAAYKRMMKKAKEISLLFTPSTEPVTWPFSISLLLQVLHRFRRQQQQLRRDGMSKLKKRLLKMQQEKRDKERAALLSKWIRGGNRKNVGLHDSRGMDFLENGMSNAIISRIEGLKDRENPQQQENPREGQGSRPHDEKCQKSNDSLMLSSDQLNYNEETGMDLSSPNHLVDYAELKRLSKRPMDQVHDQDEDDDDDDDGWVHEQMKIALKRSLDPAYNYYPGESSRNMETASNAPLYQLQNSMNLEQQLGEEQRNSINLVPKRNNEFDMETLRMELEKLKSPAPNYQGIADSLSTSHPGRGLKNSIVDRFNYDKDNEGPSSSNP